MMKLGISGNTVKARCRCRFLSDGQTVLVHVYFVALGVHGLFGMDYDSDNDNKKCEDESMAVFGFAWTKKNELNIRNRGKEFGKASR
jgi:hypothetical protein